MECIESKINNFSIFNAPSDEVQALHLNFVLVVKNLIEHDMIRKYSCEEREKESERECGREKSIFKNCDNTVFT